MWSCGRRFRRRFYYSRGIFQGPVAVVYCCVCSNLVECWIALYMEEEKKLFFFFLILFYLAFFIVVYNTTSIWQCASCLLDLDQVLHEIFLDCSKFSLYICC